MPSSAFKKNIAIAILIREILHKDNCTGLKDAQIEVSADVLNLPTKTDVVFSMNPVNAVIPLPALLPRLQRHTEGRCIRQTGEIQLGRRHNRPCAVDEVIEPEADSIQ